MTSATLGMGTCGTEAGINVPVLVLTLALLCCTKGAGVGCEKRHASGRVLSMVEEGLDKFGSMCIGQRLQRNQ